MMPDVGILGRLWIQIIIGIRGALSNVDFACVGIIPWNVNFDGHLNIFKSRSVNYQSQSDLWVIATQANWTLDESFDAIRTI